MSLGLLEKATAPHAGWLNERIVAVCAGGLVAGPWVGLGGRVFFGWFGLARRGFSRGSLVAFFLLDLGVSLLRASLLSFSVPHSYVSVHSGLQLATASVVQGFGTALILAIIGQVRDRD